MTRFGWDLPPGVTISMLPGNSPDELAAEARDEALAEALDKAGIKDDELVEAAVELLGPMITNAYSAGVADARADDAMIRDMTESVYLRKVDANTNNECWVICNKMDAGAVRFIDNTNL